MARMAFNATCKRLDAMKNTWRTTAQRALLTAADAAYDAAREQVPVDTGALRRSIGRDAAGLLARVYAAAPYAAYVELGTGGEHGHPPQPYMRPAFARGVGAAKEVLL